MFPSAYAVLQRHAFCAALIISVAWPGIVLGDSADKHCAGEIDISGSAVLMQASVGRNPSKQLMMLDATAQRTSVFPGTLDEEPTGNEIAGSLPPDAEIGNSGTVPECIPCISDIGTTTRRTATYYLTSRQSNPSSTIILGYDSERGGQFLYGMISLTIRW